MGRLALVADGEPVPHDVREASDRRLHEWKEQRENGQAHATRPPLRVDASYAVTGRTRAVEDEHRPLSRPRDPVRLSELPGDVLAGALANGSQPYPLETRVIQERSDDKSDFWTSIGGQYKASLDYGVLNLVRCGHRRRTGSRSADVRTVARARLAWAAVANGRVSPHRRHRPRRGDGQPVANAWVALPELGLWSASGSNGRFRFDRIQPGKYRCVSPNGRRVARPPATSRFREGHRARPRRGQGREGAPLAPRGSRRRPNGCPSLPGREVRRNGGRVVVCLPALPLRVLLANLEPMTVLGMTQVLADEGIDVVSDGGMPGVVVRKRDGSRPTLSSSGGRATRAS